MFCEIPAEFHRRDVSVDQLVRESGYDSADAASLRRAAHMPNLFKTPGSKAPVMSGDNNKVIVISVEERAELVRLRQEALAAMEPKQLTAPNGAVSDSGNSSGSV